MKKYISILMALTMIFLTFPASFAVSDTTTKIIFEDCFDKEAEGGTLGWAYGATKNQTGVTHTYAKDPKNAKNMTLCMERTASSGNSDKFLEQGVVLADVATTEEIQRDIVVEFSFMFPSDVVDTFSLGLKHSYNKKDMNTWYFEPIKARGINAAGTAWINDLDAVKTNEWNKVKLLLTYDGYYTLWVNGEIVEGVVSKKTVKAENIKSTKFIPSENGGLDSLLLFTTWKSTGKVYVDDFRITTDFSAELTAAAQTLTFDKISEEPENRITQDLTLMNEITYEGKTYPVEWSSSDTNFITADGTVTPKSFAGDVTVTAKIFSDNEKDTYTEKAFNVTVIEAGTFTDEEKLAQYAELYLKEEIYTGENTDKSSITKNIKPLPTTDKGITIDWVSSHPQILDKDGIVTRPTYDEGDTEVTLTATLTLNDAEPVMKELSYTVLALPDPQVVLKSAYDALTYEVLTKEERTKITKNLNPLPAEGENDTTISWEIIDGSGISVPDGTVTRGDESSNITIRATIDFYGDTIAKDFYFTVLPSETKMLEYDIAQISTAGWEAITESFNLPLVGELYDTQFVWTSDNGAITIEEGRAKVLRPLYDEGDASFNLTLAATNGNAADTKTFPVTVLKVASENELVSEALGQLTFTSISEETQDAVTKNLALPTVFDGGLSVTWETSDENTVTEKGEVIRPSYTDGNATVTLTPTVTSANGLTGTGEPITFTVLAYESDTEYLEAVKNSLIFPILSNEATDAVTKNLYLPAVWRGADIEWTSNSTSLTVDGETGKIKRPKWGKGSATVELCANITYGELSTDRKYNLSVLEEAYMEYVQTHINESFTAWTDRTPPTTYKTVSFSTGAEAQVDVGIEPDPLDEDNNVLYMSRASDTTSDGYLKLTGKSDMGGTVYFGMNIFFENENETINIEGRGPAATEVYVAFSPASLKSAQRNIALPDGLVKMDEWNSLAVEIDTVGKTYHIYVNEELLTYQGNVTEKDGSPFDTENGIPFQRYGLDTVSKVLQLINFRPSKGTKVLIDNLYLKEKKIYSGSQLEIAQAWEREFLEKNDIKNITADLLLPTTWTENINITYASSDSSIIDESGRINLVSGEKDVVWTLEINDGITTYIKKYDLHVVKTEKITLTDADAVVADVLWAINNLKKNYMLNSLDKNMTFPTKGENGSNITITSSDTSVVSNSGSITRGTSDKTITLTIKASKNGQEKTDTLSVTVAKKQVITPSTQESSSGGSGGAIKITKGEQTKGDTGIDLEQPEDEDGSKSDFSDISNDHWAYSEIKYLVDSGIMSGVSEGVIEPQRTIRREEFIKLLVSAMGIETGGNDAEFTDVESGSWYAPYIAAAKESGILNGYADGRAGIGEEISREDMAVMIYRAAELIGEKSENQFTDHEKISDYAVEAVYTLQKNGVINGMGDGSFASKAKATRAETACMIYKTLKKGLFD